MASEPPTRNNSKTLDDLYASLHLAGELIEQCMKLYRLGREIDEDVFASDVLTYFFINVNEQYSALVTTLKEFYSTSSAYPNITSFKDAAAEFFLPSYLPYADQKHYSGLEGVPSNWHMILSHLNNIRNRHENEMIGRKTARFTWLKLPEVDGREVVDRITKILDLLGERTSIKTNNKKYRKYLMDTWSMLLRNIKYILQMATQKPTRVNTKRLDNLYTSVHLTGELIEACIKLYMLAREIDEDADHSKLFYDFFLTVDNYFSNLHFILKNFYINSREYPGITTTAGANAEFFLPDYRITSKDNGLYTGFVDTVPSNWNMIVRHFYAIPKFTKTETFLLPKVGGEEITEKITRIIVSLSQHVHGDIKGNFLALNKDWSKILECVQYLLRDK